MKIHDMVADKRSATTTPKAAGRPKVSKLAALEAEIARLSAENAALKTQPTTSARSKRNPLDKECALPDSFGIKLLEPVTSRGIEHTNFLCVASVNGALESVIPDYAFRQVLNRWKSQGGKYEAKYNPKTNARYLPTTTFAILMDDFDNGNFNALCAAEVEAIVVEFGQPTTEYGQKVVTHYLG